MIENKIISTVSLSVEFYVLPKKWKNLLTMW